jgi:tRNA G18 (ribose-2'-O)-methylase SpoU
MTFSWTEKKFLSLPPEQRHKKASELLRHIHQGSEENKEVYHQLCRWLNIPCLDTFSIKMMSDRFHFHLHQANVSWQEHNLFVIRSQDRTSLTPPLSVSIYLDNLRSAFNVGNILRSVEAFRLGEVFFSSSTPFIDNPKVQKTSMGTFDKIKCCKLKSLDQLPRPFIALETADFAKSVHDFVFPKTFTLLLGNEEYGLSDAILKEVDFFVQIPLVGSKNSLNVASAFAIAAASIRK